MNDVAAEQHPEYDEHDEQFARLIAKCWADEAFKAKLLANTAETLKEEGFEVAEGITVKAVEDTNTVFHMVIPQRESALSDDELSHIVGGQRVLHPNQRGVRPGWIRIKPRHDTNVDILTDRSTVIPNTAEARKKAGVN
ncbi:NHLP leader peptide family natural product precursor [Candidatus Methylospira mobilis]|uniref:NHLP leader peptide family natural product n=1 Tax=Candidatus Methylospira mobilis TaxID=1808979 RepID=A0A5Q0BLM8_9GAMM|nr:NHLP leader peptide family RiPP precursor [Candidatus Methylospira mobilis]QFY44509.1 NHLP leader peptide family natural product precursor [Candidatus Methylospira mobilis]WNV06059.1 NHLP leader peptide family RiPP precursor [Candidatus Methylospira mobilis]